MEGGTSAMVDEQEAVWEPRARTWTRRRFLLTGMAGFVVAGGGYATLRALGSDPKPTISRFRSRPDLMPPLVEVLTTAPDATAGPIFLSPRTGPGQLGPLIVDGAGSPVWFNPRPGLVTADLKVQTYQELPVLSWWEGTVKDGIGEGEFVVVDQTYTEVARITAGNGYQAADRELVITPWHTALISATAQVEGRRVLESIVQEVEIDTGKVRFEWHSGDHVPVDESFEPAPGDPAALHDYFQLTSVDLDGEANLLVSARGTNTLYKVANPGGGVVWRLGGKKSDFRMAPGAAFARQHDAGLPAEGQIALFDNGGGEPGRRSRGLVLAVDSETMSASVRQEYVHPRIGSAATGGNLQLLDGHRVFVGWGSQPHFSEFGPDGTLLFDARFPGGNTTYRAYRFPWVAQPLDPPDATVEIEDGKQATVYASWNGATEVAAWQVLTGAGDALEAVAESPRTGFETAIRLPTIPPLVAVSAIGAAGEVLATSKRVKLAP